MGFSKLKFKYYKFLLVFLLVAAPLGSLQYIFPDHAKIYASKTEASKACAEATQSDLARGEIPRSLGCQSLESRTKITVLFAFITVIPSFIYFFFIPLTGNHGHQNWNADKKILSLLTIILPLFCLFTPLINFLDAFGIGTVPYAPWGEREIAWSVAIYSTFNLLACIAIFYFHRRAVLGSKK